MLIFKAMAFSSHGHNIFNNQYKMATVIYYREGVERDGRTGQEAPVVSGPGEHQGEPPVHTSRPMSGGSPTLGQTHRALPAFSADKK